MSAAEAPYGDSGAGDCALLCFEAGADESAVRGMAVALPDEAVGCCALPLGSPVGAGEVPCTVVTETSVAAAQCAPVRSSEAVMCETSK